MNKDIPDGWTLTTFGDVAEYINGRGFSKSEWEDEGRPIIRIQNLTGTGDTVNRYSGEVDEKHIIRDGELLISWSATIDAHIYHGEEAALNQHIFKVNTRDHTNKKFLYYLTKWYVDELEKKAQGTGMKHITKGKFEESEIPLPPLPEQKRIVAKIEELFSKLDSGVKDMRTANKRLGQYRRTILQNAVEGKLTKPWRLNQEDIEPTVQLLQRTEELRENECGGKYGKLIEPTDIPDAIELPETWAWSSLSQIGEVSRGKSTHRPRDDPSLLGGDYPFIQTGEVRAANTILNSYDQTYNEKGLEQSRLWPEGTLCITIAANIGETAILGIDACFPDSVVGFLTNPEYCNVHYVELYFRTIQRDLERYAPATAQKNINLGTLSDLPIPLPPIKEQNQIVQKVHSDLSVLKDNEETISKELVRSEKLRKSILKQAFRGELVPKNQYVESEEIGPERTGSESKPEYQNQATLSEVTRDVE